MPREAGVPAGYSGFTGGGLGCDSGDIALSTSSSSPLVTTSLHPDGFLLLQNTSSEDVAATATITCQATITEWVEVETVYTGSPSAREYAPRNPKSSTGPSAS